MFNDLKICDFGAATDLATYLSNMRGSPAYMAPEVCWYYLLIRPDLD